MELASALWLLSVVDDVVSVLLSVCLLEEQTCGAVLGLIAAHKEHHLDDVKSAVCYYLNSIHFNSFYFVQRKIANYILSSHTLLFSYSLVYTCSLMSQLYYYLLY